jgi:anti-sigma B factor antagonist
VSDSEGGHLQVGSARNGDAVILSPDGDVDLTASSYFRGEIKKALDSKPKRLVVDLSGVPYMDSSGVATLVEAMQLSRRSGVKLVLCGLQDRVRSIFEIAKLELVFTIVDGQDQALSG